MDPHSFVARAEAQRWLGIAEKLLLGHDLVGSKTFAIRARESDPRLEAADLILAIADTLLAAEKRVVGNNGSQQPDYYAILQLVRFVQDTEHIASQYRRLAVMLNPHQNRFPYADQAFQLVNDAWAVLSNPMRKSMYDAELDFPPQQQMNPIGFNLEQQHHHHHQQQQHHHHHQQQQHNFFSINHMGSGHEQELPEPPHTFQTRVQQTQQQHQQLQPHNFLSQSNPVRSLPVREQEQLFQVTSPQHREQEQLFQTQVQPFQITSAPQQPSRSQQQPPQPQAQPQPLQPQPRIQSPTPSTPAAPQQPPFSWPQASPLSQPPPQQQPPSQPHPQQQPKPHLQTQPPSQPHPQQQPKPHLQTQPPPQRTQSQAQPSPQRPQSQAQPSPRPHSQAQPLHSQLQPSQPQLQPQSPPLQQHLQQPPPQQHLQPQQQLQQEQRQQEHQHPRPIQRQESLEQNPSPVQLPSPVNINNGLREEEAEAEAESYVEAKTAAEDVDESPTFWTVCPYCFYMYEYPRVYAECTLRCDHCKRAFQAVPVPPPPQITDGQDAYFYCWGYFPIGVSMSHLEKNQGKSRNSNWTPFSPMYDASSNVQDHLNGRAAPKQNFNVNKNSGPRIYFDDITNDVFIDVSEPSDDSDGDWVGTRKVTVKRTKRDLEMAFKSRSQVIGIMARDARNGSVKKRHNRIPVQEGVRVPTVPVADSKKPVGSNPRMQSVRVAKELGKLDLNVEFNNNEGEEAAPRMTGGNRGSGQGEEDNIEGIGFFEGLDEFLSSLPILSVVNEEKVKAA